MSSPPTIPLASLVTLIITTSPTPSSPSTELLDAIVSSLRTHCAPLVRECSVVVVLDTHESVAASERLKKGRVTEGRAREGREYGVNVRGLCGRVWGRGDGEGEGEEEDNKRRNEEVEVDHKTAEYGSPCVEGNEVPYRITRSHRGRVTFIEPQRRLGFGLAVREALREARTPYVWVQQHDWPLVADVPLRGLVEVMRASEGEDEVEVGRGEDGDGVVGGGEEGEREGEKGEVKKKGPPVRYVCVPSVRMLSYAVSAHVIKFPALRELTARLKREFVVSVPSSDGNDSTTPTLTPTTIPLTPLFFWHDKPHLASRAHYLSRVFSSRLAMPRGAFIEDTVGHRAREQMKAGNWEKWACWLYYPDEGRGLCLRHLNGRKWRGEEGERRKKALWMEGRMELPRSDDDEKEREGEVREEEEEGEGER
ncbi:hypothetical protein F4810DRAFT_128501 [Camillea tinctor]|nr:hypothetical protein F4810DRAFT_128501 [Camillea tinctor]